MRFLVLLAVALAGPASARQPPHTRDWLKQINPGFPGRGRTENCVAAALATDLSLAGHPAAAMPRSSGYRHIWDVQGDYRHWLGAGVEFVGWDKDIVERRMREFGPGARAIVLVPGHVFNAINDKGRIRFFDGQRGKEGWVGATHLSRIDLFRTDRVAPPLVPLTQKTD